MAASTGGQISKLIVPIIVKTMCQYIPLIIMEPEKV